MAIIATGTQTRWKDSYASSDRVGLTLRANGEEETKIIDQYGQIVPAGFAAPTVAPSLLVSVGGSLAASTWYAYRYVYASSSYPGVDNAVTIADGELWPRSNPSGYTSDVTTAPNRTITVTVTKTTASNVDKIAVYRTEGFATQDLAENAAAAGEMFYIATVDNNGIAGTETVVDDGLTDTGETLEADNFPAATFWFTVFDGTQWWGVGNPEFTATVTLDGTNVVIQSSAYNWFDGRDGQKVTFDGITSGGGDGRGTFYFKWEDGQTASLYEDAALTVAATLPYTGTTVIHVQGPASTLYRSKPFNPFSWGYTQQVVNDDATTTNIPQSFALNTGGGFATAMAVAGNPRKLKLDYENPQKCISYDLEVASDIDLFARSAQDIDLTGSVTCHHAQFHGFLGEDPTLFGLDTYNGNIVMFNGTRHVIASDILGDFLKELDRSDDAHRFFHGLYDPETEMNCFWVRLYDTSVLVNVLIWIHAPTGYTGWMQDFDVLSSGTILDSETNTRYLMGGTTGGNIGQLFDPSTHVNWTDEMLWKNNQIIYSQALSLSTFNIDLLMDLNQETKAGQTVSASNPAAGTFTTTAAPAFQVGDQVILFDDPLTTIRNATVTIISGNDVTVSAPYTGLTAEWVAIGTTRLLDQFATIQNPDGTDEWFVHIQSAEHDSEVMSLIVDQYIQSGRTEVVTPTGTPPWPVGSRIVFGCIPCYYRAYYNLGTPVENKRAIEMWATCSGITEAEQAAPFSFADTLAGRFYVEFDEHSDADSTFLMNPTLRENKSVRSYSWARKNQVPDYSNAQFGMELREIGTEDFTLYDYTIKIRKG